MRSITIEVNETYFNLLWRALLAREAELLEMIASHDEESDEAIDAANDLVYLRLSKTQLEKEAREAAFSERVFSTDDDVIDLERFRG